MELSQLVRITSQRITQNYKNLMNPKPKRRANSSNKKKKPKFANKGEYDLHLNYLASMNVKNSKFNINMQYQRMKNDKNENQPTLQEGEDDEHDNEKKMKNHMEVQRLKGIH